MSAIMEEVMGEDTAKASIMIMVMVVQIFSKNVMVVSVAAV